MYVVCGSSSRCGQRLSSQDSPQLSSSSAFVYLLWLCLAVWHLFPLGLLGSIGLGLLCQGGNLFLGLHGRGTRGQRSSRPEHLETDDAKTADATTTRLREGQMETTVRQNPSARAAWVPERELCTTQTESDISLPQAADAKCRHGTRPGSCPHYIRWRRRPALSEIDRTNNGASQQPDVSKSKCGTGTETTGLLLSSLQNKASTFRKTWHTGIRASDTADPTEVQPVTRPRLIRPPSPSHSPLCQADQNTPLTPALLYQPQSILPAFLVPDLHINYASTFDLDSTLGYSAEGPAKAK
jgi:hypothetical protein